MSLTHAFYNAQHLVVAGDHGSWSMTNGVPHSPRFDPLSKIVEIPGLPVVVGYVGIGLKWANNLEEPGNLEFLHAWARETDFGSEWSVESIARRVWDALMERHRPKAEMLLGPLSGLLTEEQRIRVGLDVFVAGWDRGAQSPALWASNYPDREPRAINVMRYGAATFPSTGLYAVGCNDGLQRDFGPKGIYRPSPAYNHFSEEDFVELARHACAAAEEYERSRVDGVQRVIGPFDLAVVRPDGVEWLERAKGPGAEVQTPFVAESSNEMVVTADVSHVTSSTPFSSTLPGVPPFSTNMNLWLYSPLNSTTIYGYITSSPSNGTNTQLTSGTIYLANNTNVTVPAQSYTWTGFTSGTSYYLGAAWDAATNSWSLVPSTGPQNAPLTSAQLQELFQDGYALFQSSVYVSAGSGSTGGGGGCPAVGQILETRERGFIPAKHLQLGWHVRHPDGGWRELTRIGEPASAVLYAVEFDTETIRVDASHLFEDGLGSERWVNVTQLQRGDRFPRIGLGDDLVVGGVHRLGNGLFVPLGVDGMRYTLGRTISHNSKIKTQ